MYFFEYHDHVSKIRLEFHRNTYVHVSYITFFFYIELFYQKNH